MKRLNTSASLGAIVVMVCVLAALAGLVPVPMSMSHPLHRKPAKAAKLGRELAIASQNYYDEFGKWPQSVHEMTEEGNPRRLPFFIDRHNILDQSDKLLKYQPYQDEEGIGYIEYRGPALRRIVEENQRWIFPDHDSR